MTTEKDAVRLAGRRPRTVCRRGRPAHRRRRAGRLPSPTGFGERLHAARQANLDTPNP